MVAAGAAVWFLTPKKGRGVLVDAQGRRHEIVSRHPPRGLAAEILERYRRWRDPDASGRSPRDRLKGAYALLIGTAAAGAVAVALARRATR